MAPAARARLHPRPSLLYLTRPLLLPLFLTSHSPRSSSGGAARLPRHCRPQSSPPRSTVAPARGRRSATAARAVAPHRPHVPSPEVKAAAARFSSRQGRSSGELPVHVTGPLSAPFPSFHAHWFRLALAEPARRLSHLVVVIFCRPTVSDHSPVLLRCHLLVGRNRVNERRPRVVVLPLVTSSQASSRPVNPPRLGWPRVPPVRSSVWSWGEGVGCA
jgi:hypothetical protein